MFRTATVWQVMVSPVLYLLEVLKEVRLLYLHPSTPGCGASLVRNYFISSLYLSYSSTLSPLSVQTQLTLAGNRRHKSGILAQISSSGLM